MYRGVTRYFMIYGWVPVVCCSIPYRTSERGIVCCNIRLSGPGPFMISVVHDLVVVAHAYKKDFNIFLSNTL